MGKLITPWEPSTHWWVWATTPKAWVGEGTEVHSKTTVDADKIGVVGILQVCCFNMLVDLVYYSTILMLLIMEEQSNYLQTYWKLNKINIC